MRALADGFFFPTGNNLSDLFTSAGTELKSQPEATTIAAGKGEVVALPASDVMN
jgi:hypothetical protein